MVKWLLVCIALVLALSLGSVAPAAQVITKVDYHTKSILWDWAPGAKPNDGAATKFLVKCGSASGQYTYPIKEVPMPAKNIPIGSAVPVQGIAYCVVGAANDYGASAWSAEISFDAGSAPAAVVNVRVQ